MKTQVARNWKLGRTELQVTPQRGETLDVSGANWLTHVNSAYLLPVDYDPDKARSSKLQLAYDITGLKALKRRLPKVWDQDGYYTVLEGIERVEQDEPRFIYVPLDGVAYDATQNSPLLVLGALSSRRLRFDSQACSTISERLRKFVLTKGVFSLNDFRGFLDDEFPEIRRSSTQKTALWDTDKTPAADADQIAFMDSLFSSFDSGEDA